MKNRIKSVLVFILFAVFCISINAQKGFVVMKNGKKQESMGITSDAKGVLTIARGHGGRIKTKINPRDYQYARVEMPTDVKKAALTLKNKDYSTAATEFSKLYDKYKYVGWDIYCAYLAAQSYHAQKKDSAAIRELEKMGKLPVDPAKIDGYMLGMKLLAELYAAAGNESKTLSTLEILSQSNNDSLAAFSNNLRGDLLLKNGNKKDAKLMYMRTALLFDKSNRVERPEALLKTIKILREEKNNKALEFEKMLKKDYPGSKYVKDL